MIRKAKIKDASQIVYINVLGWKETYKGIFPDQFLKKLDPEDEKSIQKCREKINEYVVCELNDKIVAIARYGKNKKQ